MFCIYRENMLLVSIEKIKAGILDCPQTRQLIKDSHFVNFMNEAEPKDWNSFIAVIDHFPGKRKAENCVDLVNEMLKVSNLLGAT